LPRINVYVDVSTHEALERKRASLKRRGLQLQVSKICEDALRKALRMKERK